MDMFLASCQRYRLSPLPCHGGKSSLHLCRKDLARAGCLSSVEETRTSQTQHLSVLHIT